ncbi:MAG: formate dehydrogenase accessory sulfurtransferase FdhD [Myxococcales bacterium]
MDLAKGTGMTLCGFVRGGAMTVYAHPERLH